MSIAVAIIALCVVIIVHELGHYLAAVWTGMKVDRFSVFGIGPAIVKLGTWRGTEFVISAIPFGAYVLIRGMEPEPEEDYESYPQPSARDTAQASSTSINFRDRPLWARVAVIAGGPVANYLMAMALFFGVLTLAGVAGPTTAIEITGFQQDSAAEAAGIEAGDVLLAVGDHTIEPANGDASIREATDAYRGQTVDIQVLRGDERVTVQADLPAEGLALGVTLTSHSTRQAVSVGEAARRAVTRPLVITADQLSALYRLITGQIKAEMQGPVGIVRHIAQSAESGLVSFVATAALISTLLGMFNLLPLPALDGGRLSFLVYEAIARRRASPRVEEMVHGYGMLALLVLILVVTVKDLGLM